MSEPLTPSKDSSLVRQARRGDAGTLAVLLTELGTPTTPEEADARLAAILRDPGHRLLVLVDAADRPVGVIQAAVVPIVETGLTLQIFGLVVHTAARRRGVGRRLVAAAEAWGRKENCDIAALRSNIKRVEAHEFWPALGYRNVKTQHAYRKRLQECGRI